MRESFLLYADQLEPLEDFTLEERGIIMTAIMAYTRGREVPEMSRALKIAWSYIRSGLERDGVKYDKKVQSRAEAGRKGAEKRWQNMAKMANANFAILPDSKMAKMANIAVPVPVPDPVPLPVPEPVPVPIADQAGTQAPTAAQVEEYAKSIGYQLNGQDFVDRYEATGWTLGGQPIRDWKAVLRRWKAQDEKKREKVHNFDERSDDLDEEMRRKWRERLAQRAQT